MLSRLRNLFSAKAAPDASPAIPVIERAEIEPVIFTAEKLTRLNWETANAWIEANPARGRPPDLRRAMVSALLARMACDLSTPHRAWRSPNVEGLSPDREPLVRGLTGVAETSYQVLSRDLAVIRGPAVIPPIALIALTPLDSYVDFIAHYYPDSGEFATSGGVYLRADRNAEPDTFPTLALPILPNADFASTIAHELTHHALAECNLPLWVEEGFTQMFEERIVGYSGFTLNAEMVSRHRAHWSTDAINEFLQGHSFHSPVDDTQELSYHLAQWVVRSELSRRPGPFFEFARACRVLDADAAAQRVFDHSCEDLVGGIIGGGAP